MSNPQNELVETSLTLVSEGTRVEGHITFDSISRVHGVLIGKIFSKEGSTLILNETAVVEGEIQADILLIEGFVQGTISALTRVVISSTGRVIGDISTPSLIVEHGAFFEGKTTMVPHIKSTEASVTSKSSATSASSP